jgi:taurine dioxygenase
MRHESITVTPTSPNIGAEIGNIDLTQPLSNRQVQELHQALIDHLVIFFRDQKIDHEQHKTLGRYFGKLHVSVGGDGTNSKALSGDPEVRALHFDANSESVSGETWHTDQSCARIPPMGSILYLHTVPPDGGGDTMFASMYAAYDALSDRMKAYLEGLSAVHDGTRVFAQTPNNKVPISTHPLIARHPVSGRKLIYFTGEVVTKINNIPPEESDAIRAFLTQHCAHPDFQFRFRWKPHSIAFWDNRCAHHRAIWDYWPNTRSGFRIQIRGTEPPIPASQ